MNERQSLVGRATRQFIALVGTTALLAASQRNVEAAVIANKAECDLNKSAKVNEICTIEGRDYSFKGGFNLDQNDINTLGTLSGMTEVPFTLNTLKAGKDPIFGVWVEVGPNSDEFWKSFTDSQK